MRLAGTCHPEWGYLAPAPNFMRTARIFIIAAAIGARQAQQYSAR